MELKKLSEIKWFPFSDKFMISTKWHYTEKPNNLTGFSGGCKSKENQTFDWLTSKQP